MGAIQEPTPDMLNWRNELRSESWYLARSGAPGDGGEADKLGRILIFPRAELPALLAALQQVQTHADTSRVATSASSRRGWRFEMALPHLVAVHGPFAMIGQDGYTADEYGPAVQTQWAEIEYVDITELTALLTALAS
jgi:hypothetical protein